EYRGHCVFKFHVMVHLAKQVAEKGNPTWYWTYPDEAENRNMQRVAKSLHGGPTFYDRMLEKVQKIFAVIDSRRDAVTLALIDSRRDAVTLAAVIDSRRGADVQRQKCTQ
ncbi:unnamed protein product, partial [Prorocentrum cordatum]